MALVLSYTVTERNDNKLLTITDTAGTYHAVDNPTGWGVPTWSAPTDITAIGGGHPLELDIIITESDGTITTCDPIDLFALFGPFADAGDFIFPLTMAMLKVSTVALGTATDEFPDGIYDITYIVDRGLGKEVSVNTDQLIDGQVQNAVYELLRTVPTMYECGTCHEKETLDILFMRMYLDSVRASAVVSRSSSILSQLTVLERLVTNVSNYTW